MNTGEKLRIATQLEKLGVDIMEAGFPVASDGDFEAVSKIAEKIKHSQVAGLARHPKMILTVHGEQFSMQQNRGYILFLLPLIFT